MHMFHFIDASYTYVGYALPMSFEYVFIAHSGHIDHMLILIILVSWTR